VQHSERPKATLNRQVSEPGKGKISIISIFYELWATLYFNLNFQTFSTLQISLHDPEGMQLDRRALLDITSPIAVDSEVPL